MANPSTRQGLIDYALRSLGHPVIEINVDDDQLEDRVDQALQFYREFHYDSIEKVYLSVLCESSSITLDNSANVFGAGETLTASSGETCKVSGISGNVVTVQELTGNLSANITLTGATSGGTANVVSTYWGNLDSKSFDVSPLVTGITRVFPFTDRTSGLGVFDIRYQILINDLYTLQSTDLVYYDMMMKHLQLINNMLVGQKPIRFNRHMNKLYVDLSYYTDLRPGDYMIVEAYRYLDPDVYTDVYNDMMLKKYVTALIKKQWGENLKKFEGVQLPGGVTLNGQQIYNEAVEEIRLIEQEFRDTWEEPTMFQVG